MEEFEKRNKDTGLGQQTNMIIEQIKGKLDEKRIQSILDMIGENNIVDFITEHSEQFNEEELTIIREALSDIITSKAIGRCENELIKIKNAKQPQEKISIEKIEKIVDGQELPDIERETKTTGELYTQTDRKGELENDTNDPRT